MTSFSIAHQTRYAYSKQVFIEPHYILLRPRSDWRQRLVHFHMEIEPEPAGLSWGLDALGNERAQAWFDGVHDSLTISVRAEVETLHVNPFAYLLPADEAAAAERSREAEVLAPFLRKRYPAGSHDHGREDCGADLVEELYVEVRGEVSTNQDFLFALNRRLFETIAKVERAEPGLLSPYEALRSGKGACRDTTLLFMEVCRRGDIPARYVGGYQTGDADKKTGELHAWAEAYLPGAGWRGFDPTHGLAVADQHVVLAVGADPEQTAPVAGSFRGSGASAELSHSVSVQTSL